MMVKTPKKFPAVIKSLFLTLVYSPSLAVNGLLTEKLPKISSTKQLKRIVCLKLNAKQKAFRYMETKSPLIPTEKTICIFMVLTFRRSLNYRKANLNLKRNYIHTILIL